MRNRFVFVAVKAVDIHDADGDGLVLVCDADILAVAFAKAGHRITAAPQRTSCKSPPPPTPTFSKELAEVACLPTFATFICRLAIAGARIPLNPPS